jgi:hypothetical protein
LEARYSREFGKGELDQPEALIHVWTGAHPVNNRNHRTQESESRRLVVKYGGAGWVVMMIVAAGIVGAGFPHKVSDNSVDIIGIASWILLMLSGAGAVSVQVYRAWARDRWEGEWSRSMKVACAAFVSIVFVATFALMIANARS